MASHLLGGLPPSIVSSPASATLARCPLGLPILSCSCTHAGGCLSHPSAFPALSLAHPHPSGPGASEPLTLLLCPPPSPKWCPLALDPVLPPTQGLSSIPLSSLPASPPPQSCPPTLAPPSPYTGVSPTPSSLLGPSGPSVIARVSPPGFSHALTRPSPPALRPRDLHFAKCLG